MPLLWTRHKAGVYTCGARDLVIEREPCRQPDDSHVWGWSIFEGDRRVTWRPRLRDAKAAAERLVAEGKAS